MCCIGLVLAQRKAQSNDIASRLHSISATTANGGALVVAVAHTSVRGN
jgi:hypothetical protein